MHAMKNIYEKFQESNLRPIVITVAQTNYLSICANGNLTDSNYKQNIDLITKMSVAVKEYGQKQQIPQAENFEIGYLEVIWYERDDAKYELLIAQPQWLDKAHYKTILASMLDLDSKLLNVTLKQMSEGKCVQILSSAVQKHKNHANNKLQMYCNQHQLTINQDKYHEIYITAPNGTLTKTLIRYQLID